jgi:hypothetical protein
MNQYANLQQRIAHSYLDMLPPFAPLANSEVSVHSQEQFYRFLKQVYQALFDTPELLFVSTHEDDAFPNRFNRASYGKPKLYNIMKKSFGEIEGLISWFLALGQNASITDGKMVVSDVVKGKKKYANLSPQLGLNLDGNTLSCAAFDGLFPAWKWMAERGNPTEFGRAMFDPAYPYLQDVYTRLLGDAQSFGRLVAYLEAHGYRRFECERGPYTLDYAKRSIAAEVPLGNPIHGDPNYYGISAEYRYETAVPQFMALRILGMKSLLLKFDQMQPHLQDFVVRYAKKCDHCRYCTQTDKTGKRQELAIPVQYGVEEYMICPLYPGFNFVFETLDDPLSLNLIAFLDFMDKHLSSECCAPKKRRKETVQ